MDFLALFPLLKEVIGLFPSGADKAAVLQKVQDVELQMSQAQLDVNKAEAGNTNWFVSGWRPFIGWACGVGLIYSYIGPVFGGPTVDLNTIMFILSGMLGLGTMRTVEKVKGVK